MTKRTTNTIARNLGVALLGPLLAMGAALHTAQAQTLGGTAGEIAGDSVTSSVRVASSDLDLTSAAGAATLKHRIAVAVGEVCGTAETRDLQAMADYDQCRSAAMASATAQMQQRLAAAHGTGVFALSTPR